MDPSEIVGETKNITVIVTTTALTPIIDRSRSLVQRKESVLCGLRELS